MKHRNLTELVKAALAHSGCSTAQIGDFDSHGTIEMEMANLPAINISALEGDVWLWSSVADTNPALYRQCSQALLQFLLKGCEHGRTGQMQLFDIQGRLEVRLMLGDAALSGAEQFAHALDEFLASVEALVALVK